MINCKSYTIGYHDFVLLFYIRICTHEFVSTFFFSQDLTTLHLTRNLSRRLLLRVLVNRQVMKLTMRRNYTRKMTKMFKLLVKYLMKFPGYAVLRPLLEDMLVKITILYVTTLAPILLDLPVIWP